MAVFRPRIERAFYWCLGIEDVAMNTLKRVNSSEESCETLEYPPG